MSKYILHLLLMKYIIQANSSVIVHAIKQISQKDNILCYIFINIFVVILKLQCYLTPFSVFKMDTD